VRVLVFIKRRWVILAAVLAVAALVCWFFWQYSSAVRETITEIRGLSADREELLPAGATAAAEAVEPAAAFASEAPVLSPNSLSGNKETLEVTLSSMGSKARSDRSEFFAYFRMERDRVRSQQLELLREMAADPSTAAETRSEAQSRILELTRQMEKELELENLMVAEGFPEAAAFICSDAATVVLFSSSLAPSQQAEITSLVARMTGCAEEKVNVICR